MNTAGNCAVSAVAGSKAEPSAAVAAAQRGQKPTQHPEGGRLPSFMKLWRPYANSTYQVMEIIDFGTFEPKIRPLPLQTGHDVTQLRVLQVETLPPVLRHLIRKA